MSLAKIKLLTQDKTDEIRQEIADYLGTIPASHIVSCSPLSTFRDHDGDTLFVVAVAHQEPGAVDQEGQIVLVERDKVPRAQQDIDELLASVVHETVTGDTSVAGTVATTAPIFDSEDVGRFISSGGERRSINGFVSETEVTYSGDPLPSSASVNVSLLGAESVRDVSIDTRKRNDLDTRVSLTAAIGGGIAAGSGSTAGGTTLNTIQVNNDYTVQSGIDFVAVDASSGPVSITMPPASDGERKIHVKKIDSSAFKVTVVPDGADTIDGYAGFEIPFQNNSYIFVSNDANTWWVT